MKLIIVRHGETEENLAKVIHGHLPGKLTKLGIEQAKKLGNRLKDEQIDYIYSSDLARAFDTAKEIAKFHQTIPIKFIIELREKYTGNLQGNSEPLNWREKRWDAETLRIARGESVDEMLERGKMLVDNTLKEHNRKTILFVSHNDFLQGIMTSLLGETLGDIHNIEHLKNASVSIFHIEEDKNHKIICFNCKKHLD